MTAMPRPRQCWTIKTKCGPPWQALRLSRATGLKIGRRAIKTKGWAITTRASRITRRPTIRRSADFLEHYGVSHRMFGSTYHGTTLVLDAFLGIRYVLREKSAVHVQVQTDHYRKIAETETFEVLENPYALPLGFVIDDHDETPVPQTIRLPRKTNWSGCAAANR